MFSIRPPLPGKCPHLPNSILPILNFFCQTFDISSPTCHNPDDVLSDFKKPLKDAQKIILFYLSLLSSPLKVNTTLCVKIVEWPFKIVVDELAHLVVFRLIILPSKVSSGPKNGLTEEHVLTNSLTYDPCLLILC